MLQDIKQQIQNIDDTLNWIKAHAPEQYGQRFTQLVQLRCKLRHLAAAALEYPAIAAYGESQKGKSYVMNNLLQRAGRPFMVKADGREYNFIEEINPPTVQTEATGVVTRFTTFRSRPDRYKPDYPVLIKLLSVTEVAAVLCDGYFNDVDDYETLPADRLKALGQELYDTYSDRPEVQDVLVEDDVLDLQAYLRKYVKAKSSALWQSPYFIQLARVVRRIPATDWSRVFAPLWCNNEALTQTFERLTAALGRIDFAGEAYVKIDVVLNTGNTIMGVKCLKDLTTGNGGKADVYFTARSGQWQCAEGIDKAVLSAICRETVFKIEDEYLTDEAAYDFTMVAPDVKDQLTKGPVVKDILRGNDLIDFPGARPRLSLSSAKMAEDMDQVVKRGKVAFLFNKYSETFTVNILLFCQDYMDCQVTLMHRILADWVDEYVGDTPERRARRIADMGGSPFFVISTKFNVDLALKTNSALNRDDQLAKRWTERFMTVLYDQSFQAKPDTWFDNWDAPGSSFKNCYLLRDFKYSSNAGDGNNLFAGYDGAGSRERECLMTHMKIDGQEVNFYEKLRHSFLTTPCVSRFFANPAKSWDVAATTNNDGALYIIEQLATVARNMGQARERFFRDKLAEVRRVVKAVAEEYYRDDNADKLFDENLRKANRVARELDFTCNEDNYYFGHLVQALQLTEKRVYQELHRIITGGELAQEVHDYHNYELILKTCGRQLEQCADDETRWKCLISTYGFVDKDEAREYLERRGVDYRQLFAPVKQRKINSAYIADAVFKAWQRRLTSPEFVDELTVDGRFDATVMSTLLNGIVETALSLQLPERIEQLIAGYVNVVNISTVNVSFIADVIAGEVNNYVNDLGFHYRNDADVARLKALAVERGLPLFDYLGRERKADYEEKELTALFRSLNETSQAITPAVEQGYYAWKECMLISFIGTDKVPDYDREANEEMKFILERLG